MKNRAFTFLAVLATVFTFSQCKEDDSMHATYFWTSKEESQPLLLFINGEAISTLPHFRNELTCNNDTLKQQALFRYLRAGKYQLEARDSLGTVRSSATIKISESGLSGSGGLQDQGGVSTSSTGPQNSCIIVNLFY